jgi:hypothetical protein
LFIIQKESEPGRIVEEDKNFDEMPGLVFKSQVFVDLGRYEYAWDN